MIFYLYKETTTKNMKGTRDMPGISLYHIMIFDHDILSKTRKTTRKTTTKTSDHVKSMKGPHDIAWVMSHWELNEGGRQGG